MFLWIGGFLFIFVKETFFGKYFCEFGLGKYGYGRREYPAPEGDGEAAGGAAGDTDEGGASDCEADGGVEGVQIDGIAAALPGERGCVRECVQPDDAAACAGGEAGNGG